MKVEIEKSVVIPLAERFPELSFLTEHIKLGNRAELGYERLNCDHIDFLQGWYRQYGEKWNGKIAQLNTLKSSALRTSEPSLCGRLEQLVPAIAEFLLQDAIRGWLFKVNAEGKPLAYLVNRVDYTPAGEEETGRVLIELKANSLGKIISQTLTFLERDIQGKNVAQMFAQKGFLKETPELISVYTATEQKYFEWRSAYGKQFLGQGTGVYAEDPSATHRSRDWTRKSLVILSSNGAPSKLVNDEAVLANRELTLEAPGNILSKYLRKAAKSMAYDEAVEKATEDLVATFPAGLFTALPVHGYIFMFHLELHHHLWVHVDDMCVYEYQPELKEKLILPAEQIDLIDILTAEMDVLMDDVVAGKSGGTTVLCAGPAGVGKTLTAEVYSEIIKRPLYRVHSGQLGLNVAEMEQALKDTLTRAQRWGAIMLIDEADVYIRRRCDNIAANAVVGVFLRVLEYFNGLLFLTTNRVDDIDEAIISRCIALIQYAAPDAEDRERIWQVMAQQFSLPINRQLANRLALTFPKASGRDIKGLAKLVAKYCRHQSVPPTIEVFKRCSIFRGMEISHV